MLGVALGGVLAAQFGWRWAFAAMGVLGLVLAGLYWAVIGERRLTAYKIEEEGSGQRRAKLSTLFSTPAVVLAYLGGGLQLFIAGSLFAWLPSYFNRGYSMAPDAAAKVAAVFILIMGVGMIVCGAVADRADSQATAAIAFCVLSAASLAAGFALEPGGAQLPLLAVGCFFVGGSTGPTGAMVARLTHESIRATAFGTYTFFNNLLGLAAGPLVTGILADRLGLETAMRYVPLVSVAAIALLIAGRAAYPSSLARIAR
nr:hypothetical protein GCM10020092_074400 [Actinoplanes digitatis]